MKDCFECAPLPPKGAFTITAGIEHDCVTRPDDFDCYTPSQVEAFENDEWQFVTLCIEASIEGIVLGNAYLGAIEYGDYLVTDENDNKLERIDITLEKIISPEYGYIEDLTSECLFDAEATLERIQKKAKGE